mgnify:FL=1
MYTDSIVNRKDYNMSNEISFGISLGAKAEYTYSELNNFIECAEGIEPKS